MSRGLRSIPRLSRAIVFLKANLSKRGINVLDIDEELRNKFYDRYIVLEEKIESPFTDRAIFIEEFMDELQDMIDNMTLCQEDLDPFTQ